ncbi:MAG: 16S rRNA (cytidine(1402)-2'-O)-methyltransferase [Candidatus Cloacimonetes bacterium]|nr:16S rRNA (cytidine(1402)-2'-O)-methyltransferase [Candidatus Cloacimonadota bacterium]
MSKGALFIVPTPIGNLQDITFRAIETLKSVAIIYAEDTRNSGKLLKHFEISTSLKSYHKFNERARVDEIISKLKSGEDVAIISDAGTPGISDPAQIIVKKCVKNGIQIIPIPGAIAAIVALSASGLSTESFSFYGFIPKTEIKQKEFLKNLISKKETLIFYESPKRVEQTLHNFLEIFGNREVVIAKELTKIYETFFRGKIKKVLAQLNESNLKGEFVILLEGAGEIEVSDSGIANLLEMEIISGKSQKDAVKNVSENLEVRKNRVYQILLKLGK